MNDENIQEILHRLLYRFYGKYRGTVTHVDSKTLRIKAKVPSVLGTQPTGWCMPCVPYAGKQVGLVFLPEIGSGVWIEFEGGDVSYPIWVGCYWRDKEQPEDATATVKAIITNSQIKILFDDDAKTVTISDPNQNTVILTSSGITLTRGSCNVQVGESNVNINDGAFAVSE